MGIFSEFNIKKKLAFTLAEVLIVVGIIGIVAELTIPTLVKDFQEKVLVTQLKKMYSVLSQAYAMARNDNGEPRMWSVTGMNDIANIFIPYLQTNKVDSPAGQGFSAGIMSDWGYPAGIADLRRSTINYNIRGQVQLKTGEFLYFSNPVPVPGGLTCTTDSAFDMCFLIIADVNGQKPPNRFGVDVFGFQANKSLITPFGAANAHPTAAVCSTSANTSWGNISNGAGCTAWVIEHENMDYLKYIDGGNAAYNHSYIP